MSLSLLMLDFRNDIYNYSKRTMDFYTLILCLLKCLALSKQTLFPPISSIGQTWFIKCTAKEQRKINGNNEPNRKDTQNCFEQFFVRNKKLKNFFSLTLSLSILFCLKYKSTINTMRIISSFFNYLLGIVLLSEFLRCFAQTHKYIMFH